ncbi:anhydro-N-acetylmuramic acid kinase [Synechococcus sp. YX-04-1]|uniref:anhydro-N-acetylmuramic acid kinase n=1 Tax=Synechococcus sp. YX-04-1 TaxID=3062778 RepID=UPI0026E286ED|nr:anhydro-N-acetylmuramic acid kinase [Synechococcus sp. YX-04-1]MDO6352742.1 anhydro-N-acetylmuramic acid kinase [Synechococcus sp. YX-04-1]
MHCLGLMSGTSADGVDAVLASFDGPSQRPQWSLLHHHHQPYPLQLQQQVVAAGQGEPMPAAVWLQLAEAITEVQAAAARACDPDAQAELIGCHGQTVWHRPPAQGAAGASWQMLQAPLLAHLLQRPVVHNFRAADLVLGGQGAPLVPRADAALLGRTQGWRALLNLGGIANLTLIPPGSGGDRHTAVLGWDCGPANSLIDLGMRHFTNGAQPFDKGGAMAAQGRADEGWIQRWLQEDYFQLTPPKSTGRESFGQDDLNRRLLQLGGASAADAIATLTAFPAAVVAQDLEHLRQRRGVAPIELITAGGGSQNPVLIDELRRRCRGLQLDESSRLGVPTAAREALVFALLAWWHHKGHPGNVPAVTGARREAVLGVQVNPA